VEVVEYTVKQRRQEKKGKRERERGGGRKGELQKFANSSIL
jgi:hypothetical protein